MTLIHLPLPVCLPAERPGGNPVERAGLYAKVRAARAYFDISNNLDRRRRCRIH